ncbi:PstS family phosphate ABC transporter substrate-binding protein [Daejeonella oryzae]|uniref:PstS family phosphate ABC transporter substrate-binding protein n=1 Tax=Daejeonella oryzae TaxID=1122943 RepID=UPI000404AB7B|nr:substrate-binding domain-containing protein [Daejeonella oryzae]
MKLNQIIILYLISVLSISCGSSTNEKSTYTSGTAKILVDESFSPIVEDQAYVFENAYPNTKLDIIYKAENELLNLFFKDSIRVAILSRELKPDESKFYENKNIKIRVNRFAIDGIALVNHQSSPDSTITVSEIITLMQGKKGRIKSLVFDNPNSSTVRYFKDLSGIKDLPKDGVYALKSNPDVIRYVNDNPGAIGVIGINWIVQPDKDLEPIVNNLKILGVKNIEGKSGSDKFYKPNQNDLAMGLYPLTRSLYIIDAEGRPGLGTGFATFIAGERGQRIVLKSGLLPDSIPSREVIIRQNN